MLAAVLVIGATVIAADTRRAMLDNQQARAQARLTQAATTEDRLREAEIAERRARQAALAEAATVTARIAELKSLREALGDTIGGLKKRARASAAASRRWDRTWAERQASYASRYAAVQAHNRSERARYEAGMVETADSSGRLVVRPTYTPTYWSYPDRPTQPGPLRVSVAPEVERLTRLKERVDKLRSVVASEGEAAQAFEPVYPLLEDASRALESAINGRTRKVRAVVVTRGAKGQVIDAARIPTVSKSALDGPFIAVDRAFAQALADAGLSPDDVNGTGAGP
jgi:hypothetical protein